VPPIIIDRGVRSTRAMFRVRFNIFNFDHLRRVVLRRSVRSTFAEAGLHSRPSAGRPRVTM
jgi:hypothetical protein